VPLSIAVAFVRRHVVISALAIAAVPGAAVMPVVAYVIVPALVRSTLVEDRPENSAGAAGPIPAETVRQGELVRITRPTTGAVSSGSCESVRIWFYASRTSTSRARLTCTYISPTGPMESPGHPSTWAG